MIAKFGYTGESHKVETEDGYILTIHRVYQSRIGGNGSRPVFFLQHGLACSSSLYLAPPRADSMALQLADRGFDVWMGNARGNLFAGEHVKYNITDPEFWDYSWHEMGIYDMPAMIDYILNTTGRNRIFVLGHSMGAAMITVFLATKPEYNKNIIIAFGLAPAVHLESMRSTPLRYLCTQYATYLQQSGPSNWLPNVNNFTAAHWKYCDRRYPTYLICHVAYRLLAGPSDVTIRALPTILQTMPTSVSIKTFSHFGQNIKTATFRPYSYGEKLNLERYGSEEPPDYNLKNVKVPFALLYSEDDYAVHPRDVERLGRELPNVISIYKLPMRKFNHLDFAYGTHVQYLFNEIFRVLEQHQNEIG